MNEPTYRRGARLDVEITDLAFPSGGVTRLDGMVTFVDNALPGDRATIEITRRKQRHLEARLVKLLTPSPDRVEPRCAHFGLCGGCRLQDLAYQRQLDYKAAQLRNHLQRLGGLDDPGEISVTGCEPNYGYRNKMEFTFGRDSSGQLMIGLHPRRVYQTVFDLQECHLAVPEFAQILALSRDFFRHTGDQPYDAVEHTGLLRFLVIRSGQNTDELLINLVTAAGEVTAPHEWVAKLRAEVPQITTIVRSVNDKPANIAVGDLTDIWHGPGSFSERLEDFTFTLGPQSFFQTNTKQAEKLFGLAIDYAELKATDRVLDLYSGVGTISFFAARQAASVTGIELSPTTVAAAKEAAQTNNVSNCEFHCSDARIFLKSELAEKRSYDVVFTDPPRAGLHPKVIRRLLELAAPRMVYVSCNPATLARDLGRLCAQQYQLTKISAVDMFPHTTHIEAVAQLKLAEKQ